MCSYFWHLKHCMRWQFLWYSSQCLSLFWKSSFLLMSMLICADKITFIIKHIIVLLNLMIFFSHCVCRISILFLKYLFYFMSYCIVFFCLMQSKTATFISCIMTENFLWLIWIFLFIVISQLLFCFSCFFIFSVLIIITTSLLNNFLIVSIFLNIFWLFFCWFSLLIEQLIRHDFLISCWDIWWLSLLWDVSELCELKMILLLLLQLQIIKLLCMCLLSWELSFAAFACWSLFWLYWWIQQCEHCLQ